MKSISLISYFRFHISCRFLTDMKKIMSLNKRWSSSWWLSQQRWSNDWLTESMSRFDSMYPANSTSFIRFVLIKRVVNELIVLAEGIKSVTLLDEGENVLILKQNPRDKDQFWNWNDRSIFELTQRTVLKSIAKYSKMIWNSRRWKWEKKSDEPLPLMTNKVKDLMSVWMEMRMMLVSYWDCLEEKIMTLDFDEERNKTNLYRWWSVMKQLDLVMMNNVDSLQMVDVVLLNSNPLKKKIKNFQINFNDLLWITIEVLLIFV